MTSGHIDPAWSRLGLTREDWTSLALALFALAHGSRREFDGLPEGLKGHPAGQLCAAYIEGGDDNLLDQAGFMLTNSRQWYTYLGRSF